LTDAGALCPGIARGDHGVADFEHPFLLELAEQFAQREGGGLIGKSQHDQAAGFRRLYGSKQKRSGHWLEIHVTLRAAAERPRDP